MVRRNISAFSLKWAVLYFKGMLDSINFCKRIFLHVILVCISSMSRVKNKVHASYLSSCNTKVSNSHMGYKSIPNTFEKIFIAIILYPESFFLSLLIFMFSSLWNDADFGATGADVSLFWKTIILSLFREVSNFLQIPIKSFCFLWVCVFRFTLETVPIFN